MTSYRPGIVAPPYRYRSDGPWRLAAEDFHGVNIIELTTFDTLFEAVAAFDRFHLPPCQNRTAGVYDENGQLVVYYTSPDGIEVAWSGTAEGFELLEMIYDDPASVVLWAAAARGDFDDLHVGL